MAETINEVVIGATRKTLVVSLVDDEGNPVNISGGSVRLQGSSALLPGVTIDSVGAIVDAANGVARWSQLGSLVTTGQLGALSEAAFRLRVKLTDSASLVDYGPEFSLTWVKPPV